MSPAARASATALAVLLAELKKDRAALARHEAILSDGAARWQTVEAEAPLLSHVCVSLHGWYTALETSLERVARALDGVVPGGERSHRDLLAQMTVELPALRPRLLTESDEAELVELLKFRHFFRHAYSVPLDPTKVRLEVDRVARIRGRVSVSLDELERFLAATLADLSSQP